MKQTLFFIFLLTTLSLFFAACGDNIAHTGDKDSCNKTDDKSYCDGNILNFCNETTAKWDKETCDYKCQNIAGTFQCRDNPGDTGNTANSGNSVDSGNSADSGNTTDSGNTANSADTADSGNSGDTANTADTSDSADSGDSGDSADSTDSGDTIDSGDTADTADTIDTADTSGECRLESDFLTPRYSKYFTLRQTGKIFDYEENGDTSAVSSESRFKIGSFDMNGTWGAYLNFNSQVLLAQTQGYEFTKINPDQTLGRVKLGTTMIQLHPSLIPTMISDGIRGVYFGPFTTVNEIYIDVKIDSSGRVTEQYSRRECLMGIMETRETTDEGETFDVPVGRMYGCFTGDQTGAVGETLKMMFNVKLTDDETARLTYLNTRSDETIAKPGESDYREICRCYDLDKTEIDCADFDPDEALFPEE